MNNRLYRLRAESLSLSPVIVPIYCLTLCGTIIIPLLRHETLGAEKGCGAGRASIHIKAVHLIIMRDWDHLLDSILATRTLPSGSSDLNRFVSALLG